MNTRRNIKIMMILFIALFALLALFLLYIINAYGDFWFSSPYNLRVTEQKSKVHAGAISDRNGEVLAYTDEEGVRQYIESEDERLAVSHVVGDNYGQILGAQSLFSKYLLGFEQNLGDRIGFFFSGDERYGMNISLSIDAELCAYANEVMGDRRGAIVLMNYKTGEVLLSTSSPGFDPYAIEAFVQGETELEDGSLVNRVTMGRYTPGSTYKIITTIAALRHLPGVENRTFYCDGPHVFDKETGALLEGVTNYLDKDGNVKDEYVLLRDHENARHGELTLMQAFSSSCNHVFSQLALEIGAINMQKVAEELYLNNEFMFSDMVVYTGSYTDAVTDFELMWSGVGQHTDIMTPMHMCLITSAIANNGVMMEPKLLREAREVSGTLVASMESNEYNRILSTSEVAFLQDSMRSVVQRGTGTAAKVPGYIICGKTGTAEVSSNEKILPHAWFTGYVQSDEHPYAICVVLENSGSGGSVAGSAAGKILTQALGKLNPSE